MSPKGYIKVLSPVFGIAVLVFSGSVLIATVIQPNDAEIRLEPGITYQTISGWEATVTLFSIERGWYQDAPELAALRDREVIERLTDEIGINRIRLEIRAGAENSGQIVSRYLAGDIPYERWREVRYAVENDNDDPNVINPDGFDFAEFDQQIERAILPMRDMLRARGQDLFINLNYVAFTNQIVGGEYLHDNPEEYAEFVLATYLHMQEKYGFVPNTWEVILEPDQVSQWNGTVIGHAIVAAALRLEAHGFTPSFIAPSVTNMDNAVPYFDAMATVPGALQYVRELSYHRYGGRTLKNLRAIAARAHDTGIATSMLEWWFGHATYEVLHEDLKIGNNVAWQGRVMALHFIRDEALPAGIPMQLQEDVRYTLQYTHYVRAGAVRIEADSSNLRRFDPVAFINPGGGYCVIIKAARKGTVTIRNLPAGEYEISYAVAENSVQRAELVSVSTDGTLTTTMPSKGVLSVAALRRP
ncbi:MAG: hypothetical protein O7B81_16140 [Gammaproteobacteria bacterium]|nr:hypothetical protein [Gammaproteobacteria bacterium]